MPLITRDYQYEYNGLLMGSDTPYFVESISGLLGMPSATPKNQSRQGHGSYPGPQDLEDRVIDFDLYARGGSGADAEVLLEDMGGAIHPRPDELPFIFKRPGRVMRRIYARCQKADFDTGYEVAMGLAGGSVEFVCSDPLYYSEELKSTDWGIPDTLTNSQAVVTNAGKYSSKHILIIIDGPATNPIIANNTHNNRQIRTQVTLGLNDTLVIDTYRRTATLNGVDNYNVIRTDSQWWDLLPGDNTIVYNRSDAAASSDITIEHRDAWVM